MTWDYLATAPSGWSAVVPSSHGQTDGTHVALRGRYSTGEATVGDEPVSVPVQRTKLDAGFHEAAALDEIELFSELLIVAGERSQPLTPHELDSLLGIRAAS